MLIEYRHVQGKLDRIPGLLAELMQLKVDVLVSPYWPVIHAARQATRIPIVIVTTLDPVATGLVDSMAHPGGNITGLARLTQELSGKRLELLKEVIPGISRVGYLWLKDNTVPGAIGLKESEAAAHALKIQLLSLRLRSRDAQARSLSGGMVFSLLTPDESRTLR